MNNEFKTLAQNFFETSDVKIMDKIHEEKTNIPLWHLDMLTDLPRLEYYKSIISKQVAGKVVLDIGSGSGILSHLALKYGAKKVYSVEHDLRLSSIYAQTMSPHIKAGKAILLEKDAHELTLEDCGGEFPEIIIHEIFSADAFAENVSSVFTSLAQKGFLEKAKILPSTCEVLVEPVFHPKRDLINKMKDFEDFPLEKLSHFAAWKRFQLNEKISDNVWLNVGEEKLLFSYNLHRPEITNLPDITLQCHAECSHLRVSIRLKDQYSNESLDTSHARAESHWNNIFFSIPDWHSQHKTFKASFRVWENQLDLYRIVPTV